MNTKHGGSHNEKDVWLTWGESQKITDGWVFMSADFSVQAHGKPTATGIVTLIRSPSQRALWHAMPEEMKDDDNGPPLYIIGHGFTLDEAIQNAQIAAIRSKPIPKTIKEIA